MEASGLLNAVVSISVFVFSVWLIRSAAKKLLGKQWEHWYIRRTVDAFLFFTILFVIVAGYWGGESVFWLPEQINPKYNSWTCGPLPAQVKKASDDLATLLGVQYFLDHFFFCVIFPTSVFAAVARYAEWLVLRGIDSPDKKTK